MVCMQQIWINIQRKRCLIAKIKENLKVCLDRASLQLNKNRWPQRCICQPSLSNLLTFFIHYHQCHHHDYHKYSHHDHILILYIDFIPGSIYSCRGFPSPSNRGLRRQESWNEDECSICTFFKSSSDNHGLCHQQNWKQTWHISSRVKFEQLEILCRQ